MVPIKLTVKSSSDKKPTLSTNELRKLGLIPNDVGLENGDVLLLKLSPIGSVGVIADQEFRVSRNGATAMAKDGWNNYLFGMPAVSSPMQVNCAGVVSLHNSYGDELELFDEVEECCGNCDECQDNFFEEEEDSYSDYNETKKQKIVYETPTKKELKQLLKRHGYKKSACAKELGVSPRTFGRFLERRDILVSELI